jgi:phosphatidylglycerol:prolipoprotein diacylglycerol transferase
MYLVGFALLWALGRYAIKTRKHVTLTAQDLDDALFYGIIGVIAGGRLGYVLFYKLGDYLAEPWRIFYVWEGGMSFHGGFLGVIIALWWFARSHHKRWLEMTDFIAPLVPLGLATGRLGNFINAELWGRATDVPWAMSFPTVDRVPRHPSQLYELALEGIVLFLILWFYSAKPRPRGDMQRRRSVRYCRRSSTRATRRCSRITPDFCSVGLIREGHICERLINYSPSFLRFFVRN